MKNLKLFVIAFLTTAHAFAADKVVTDPAGDIDQQGVKSMCMTGTQTDMIETTFSREGDNFVATMTMTEDIGLGRGYKEYYFWIDVNQKDKRGRPVGYQPYNPDSVAWPDMYADYRIFMSLDANNSEGRAYPNVRLQNCSESDCADDAGLRYTQDIKVEIKGPKATFTWPKSLLPDVEAAKSLKLGYTTYHEIGYCHGEDDAPQWGKNAIVVQKPASSTPAPAPAPKPQ